MASQDRNGQTSVGDYRSLAEQAFRQAQGTLDPAAAAALRELAEYYRTKAESLADMKRPAPRQND